MVNGQEQAALVALANLKNGGKEGFFSSFDHHVHQAALLSVLYIVIFKFTNTQFSLQFPSLPMMTRIRHSLRSRGTQRE